MPNYRNKFAGPKYVDHDILDANGGVVGTIRVKPSTILWKPKNQHTFYSIGLDDFHTWITAARTGAARTKS
ncbi:MAG: hypothetical protein Q7K03_08475 [Dehalococcoidia bacterium]|nr:hypothetical protein [Dehalococcoidia bacterium]